MPTIKKLNGVHPSPSGALSSSHVNTPHQLWDLLSTGGVAVSDSVPPSRFNGSVHRETSGKPGTLTAGAMFIEDIDPAVFDAPFFNISKADAVAMDPQQRQILEVVYECLENGGITLQRLSGEKVGAFVGSFMNGGLTSVDIACHYLRTGGISGAIVAAANLQLSPEVMMDTGTMRAAWSPTGQCHSFDAKADGYCRAEAVNALFLKRLSDAIRDGDPIRAVIRGTSTNSDGNTPGITNPSGEAQAAAIYAAYVDAGLDGDYAGTGYLECHGTGTPVGDVIEVKAAASVLSHMRSPSNPLIIGSVKSNIGHSEPAAGISGLIKAMIAVETGIIPGNPTFIIPNPNIDFQGLHVRAVRESISWPKTLEHYRRASVNSFGYGGSNAHIVLENATQFLQHRSATYLVAQPSISSFEKCDARLLPPPTRDCNGNEVIPAPAFGARPQVLVFSANDEDSLKRQVDLLSQHVADTRVNIKLSDLSYTLSARRSRHYCRAFLSCDPDASGCVNQIQTNLIKYAKKPQSPPKIVFVFTGQGAQWSQMGAGLLRMFPETAGRCIAELDDVLRELPEHLRPEWSLLEELTEPRSSEYLRQPEISQPLSLALQLAMLAVLDSWHVRANFVVGHSSGEVAAACSAGLLTPAQAILGAYLRGLSAKEFRPVRRMGMLAVGLAPEAVLPYLKLGGYTGEVSIACYNSPSSVTLSGPAELLSELGESIKADGQFSRKLQVDLAYHSHNMNDIAERCESLLLNHGDAATRVDPKAGVELPTMISSVTQKPISKMGTCDAAYWRTNITSPVRFAGALKRILTEECQAPSILIEIGPSNTLSGPISQIVKEAGVGNSTYTSTMKRGEQGLDSLLDMAGQLFLRDASISLESVNTDETKPSKVSPAVIVDLPNYSWNHSTRYWHESLASSDWRFKAFPHHDLLGDKVLGSLWQFPSWRKTIRLADLPWLKDHRVGPEIIFPAAGYMTMAMEAVRQTMWSTASPDDFPDLDTRKYHYTLKDIRFPRGLVLEDGVDTSLMLTLAPMEKIGSGWWEYKVRSLITSDSPATPDQWNENSGGLIRLVLDKHAPIPTKPRDAGSLPLNHPSPGRIWYKAMADVGQTWGPDFQQMLSVECTEGQPYSRSLVSLVPPSSKWEPQSEYPLHPACMDGVLQAVFPSHYHGSPDNVGGVLLPARIDHLMVSGRIWNSNEALAIGRCEFQSVGIPEESRKPQSHAFVFDPLSGDFIMELKGLVFTPLDLDKSVHQSHTYSRLSWKPDWYYLDNNERLQQALDNSEADPETEVQELLDLIAHKKPNLKILEANLASGGAESLWLSRPTSDHSVRGAFSEFHLAYHYADDMRVAEDRYSQTPNVRLHTLSLCSDAFAPPEEISNLDLRHPVNGTAHEERLEPDAEPQTKRNMTNGHRTSNIFYPELSPEDNSTIKDVLGRHRFAKIRRTRVGSIVAEAAVSCPDWIERKTKPIVLLHLSSPGDIISRAVMHLRDRGWGISELHLQDVLSISQLPPKSTVLVLSELREPLLATVTETQWTAIQTVIQRECNLLWVTQGSQMTTNSPFNAICHGVFRTVRAEEPQLRIVTLDVETSATEVSSQAIGAIDRVLHDFQHPRSTLSQCEYVERHGLLYISRILPNEALNRVNSQDSLGGRPPIITNLHAHRATVRLVSEKLGSLDSLAFVEVADGTPPVLRPDEVEVEIFASGCNFKDVAVSMGIVPEDQTRLGLDGAGIVVRLGVTVNDRYVGQRVAVLQNGCFANRITVSSKATVPIPDFMTFEEAATLPVVFGTSMYGLYHLANLQQGQKVLIHSAAGGIGLASIQLCQRLNCDIFATVGNAEKREFLKHEFGIPDDHIFSSRSISFGRGIRDATQGYGVDVVMNSLTGDLLHESWRILAQGGTMIEIGKRDILARNWLPMDPFSHNRSFRSLDLSTLPLRVVGRVLCELSVLIRGGHVRPIAPRRIFSYRDIPAALQLLRTGSQIGKLVISDGPDTKVAVPVRPTKQHQLLQGEGAIFIVGGLKGVCGSIAVHLARQGAKHLAIMSRSGHEDEMSQRVVHNLRALGCSVDLLRGDVTIAEDVQRCFTETRVPISSIIQGAMVLRDRTFASMSHIEFTEALACKVQGTWNLHTVSLETQQPVASFIALSSVSGLVGLKGQTNYAGGNVFQDAFAAYRRNLGLPAISINLGPVEDVGVINANENLQSRFDERFWRGINGILLRQILDFALIQQHGDPEQRLCNDGETQLITGIKVPQPADSPLLNDVRFAGLRTSSQSSTQPIVSAQKDKEIQALLQVAQAPNPNHAELLAVAVTAMSVQFSKLLGLKTPMDPARPLGAYGMDSLAAVELRNWVRGTIGVELTTLEVMNAASLVVLCEKMVGRMNLSARS
ncbi:hypothetical protein F5Y04DRAFT_272978 [Hypomontagnella monticulosa]|nr:hypothetical protein F5Y04DRAFT_272978 [Hypomontagnella monticulosa]